MKGWSANEMGDIVEEATTNEHHYLHIGSRRRPPSRGISNTKRTCHDTQM